MAQYLSKNGKKMWIRHVLVPGITTDERYLKQLREFIDTLKTVDRVEVLPNATRPGCFRVGRAWYTIPA